MRAKLPAALSAGLALALPAPAAAGTPGSADVAALQAGLSALGLYSDDIDGFAGPVTLAALRKLPGASTPLAADTRAALGDFGRTRSAAGRSSRLLGLGRLHPPVSPRLARLPSGTMDGGSATARPPRSCASSAGRDDRRNRRAADVAALRGPVPTRRSGSPGRSPRRHRRVRPTRACFHTGIDFPRSGRAVLAAGDARRLRRWDRRLRQPRRVAHGSGVTSWYGHLSRILVPPGRGSPAARPSAASARPGTRPGRTCTSRCASATPRSTPRHRDRASHRRPSGTTPTPCGFDRSLRPSRIVPPTPCAVRRTACRLVLCLRAWGDGTLRSAGLHEVVTLQRTLRRCGTSRAASDRLPPSRARPREPRPNVPGFRRPRTRERDPRSAPRCLRHATPWMTHTRRRLPLQNRVTPLSELIADARARARLRQPRLPARRGGAIRRLQATRRWIGCRLEFKGWHRSPLMRPGKFTELFFLDEATAFAAGHRPCALCRREDYNRFLAIAARRAPTRSTSGSTRSGSTAASDGCTG